MKAMVLHAPSEIRYEEFPDPESQSEQTLIEVTHTGICGTDLKIYQGGIPTQYPLIMGHESIGEVVEGGKIPSKTRVLVDPTVYCGTCYYCQAGQTNLCPYEGLIGRDRHGGFAEYLTAPGDNLYILPDEVGSAEAPLIQPLTTCVHAVRLAGIFPGEAVVVLGLGVTGLMHIQLAKAHGAYPVIGITRSPWKRELAESLGADLTFAPDDNTLKNILEATEGRGADLVIESVGQLFALAQAIDYTRLGGRLLPFGIYTEKEGALPFYDLYFKEILVVGARSAKPEDFTASIDYVSRGVVQLQSLISHTFALEEMGGALELLHSGASNRMKIILDHS